MNVTRPAVCTTQSRYYSTLKCTGKWHDPPSVPHRVATTARSNVRESDTICRLNHAAATFPRPLISEISSNVSHLGLKSQTTLTNLFIISPVLWSCQIQTVLVLINHLRLSFSWPSSYQTLLKIVRECSLVKRLTVRWQVSRRQAGGVAGDDVLSYLRYHQFRPYRPITS